MNPARPPFERTVCACASCQECCRQQPGHLIPSDIARMEAALAPRTSRPGVRDWLVASPGALVGRLEPDPGGREHLRAFWIGTITPARDPETGACIFLTAENLCGIHDVAPFGCGFFDVHMDFRDGHARSSWGLRVIQADAEYREFRGTLAPAVPDTPHT